jgi:hypothetical protein
LIFQKPVILLIASAIAISYLYLVLLGALKVEAPATLKPNIVLMMSDDQGWGETSYNDHPYLQTKVLDEMAESGLRFDRFSTTICFKPKTVFLRRWSKIRQVG